MVSMMWVCPLSTSTALLWLMSSNLTPLAARTWSPTRMPFCSASPPGSTLERQVGRAGWLRALLGALLLPHTSTSVSLCPSTHSGDAHSLIWGGVPQPGRGCQAPAWARGGSGCRVCPSGCPYLET
uniref:Secreted protein n=1 Tax=Calidris pygmaea TaxID=425635 RepID=A0A8C3PIT8_9CHAR